MDSHDVDAYSNVDIVFGDLVRAHEELATERNSPRQVRVLFARFIGPTQTLTDAMRKEFQRTTSEEWSASSFASWTPATDVCKKLRNVDQHGIPALVQVRQRVFVPISPESNLELAVEFTWSLDDPFSDLPPEGIRIVVGDPRTGRLTERRVIPRRVEHDYIVWSESDQARTLIAACKSDDLHDIAAEAMETYRAYHRHYREQLSQRTSS